MKRGWIVLPLFGCGLSAAYAQTAQTPKLRNTAPERRIMAPPPETLLAPKLRPSTAESGLSHVSKAPLKELPDFTAKSGGSTTNTRKGHWLLVYRDEHCVSCDRLMNALAASESADLQSGVPYTVIVGGSSPAAVSNVRSAYSTLNKATWVPDGDRKLYSMLQLHGAPMLFGMSGNRVIWQQAGTLGDTQGVLHRTDAWIAGTAAANNAKTSVAAAATQAAPSTHATSHQN